MEKLKITGVAQQILGKLSYFEVYTIQKGWF